MPDPDDLQSRLSAMAQRRVAASDRAAPLARGSRRRIRRGERVGAALATLVVVALVAGGVALARSGQEQATTVRVGQPSGTATCYPPGIPRGLASTVRSLARAGQAVPGATPRAMVAALPTTASPDVTIDLKAFGGGWDLIITGLHFAPWGMGPNGIDPDPGSDNGESVLLGRDLQFKGAASVAVPADLAALDPIAVSLDPACDHAGAVTSEPSSTTVIPRASTTSTTANGGAPAVTVAGAPTPPACVGSQVSLTASTDKSTYAAGDRVKLTVTIRNNGPTCENSSPVDLIDSCPGFQVADSAGTVVYRPAILCPQPLTLASVDAGYHRSVTFTWPDPTCRSTTCTTDVCPDAACDTHVPAGTYNVTPTSPVFDGLKVHATTIRIT